MNQAATSEPLIGRDQERDGDRQVLRQVQEESADGEHGQHQQRAEHVSRTHVAVDLLGRVPAWAAVVVALLRRS